MFLIGKSWECSGLVTCSWVFLGNLVEFSAQPETQNMLYRLNWFQISIKFHLKICQATALKIKLAL